MYYPVPQQQITLSPPLAINHTTPYISNTSHYPFPSNQITLSPSLTTHHITSFICNTLAFLSNKSHYLPPSPATHHTGPFLVSHLSPYQRHLTTPLATHLCPFPQQHVTMPPFIATHRTIPSLSNTSHYLLFLATHHIVPFISNTLPPSIATRGTIPFPGSKHQTTVKSLI